MPWGVYKPDSIYDSRLLDRLKQSFCHLNLDHCGEIEGRFMHSPPGDTPREFSLSVAEEAMITVLGAFSPDMLALTGPKRSHLHAPQVCDPQDPHDDLYILQTQRKRGDAEFDEGDDEDGLPTELKDPIRLETIPIPQVSDRWMYVCASERFHNNSKLTDMQLEFFLATWHRLRAIVVNEMGDYLKLSHVSNVFSGYY